MFTLKNPKKWYAIKHCIIILRLGIVVTLSSRQFGNEDNDCRNKMMETIKTIKILEIMDSEKHN